MSQLKLIDKKTLREAGANAGKRTRVSRNKIGLGFNCDWMRNWPLFQPITKQSSTKPKQRQLTFDTQLKITSYSQKCV